MDNTISFEEVLKRMNSPVPQKIENANTLSDIELAWQMAVVTIQREARKIGGSDKLISLNRFLEFDAGNAQPIFKTVAFDYDIHKKYVHNLITMTDVRGIIDEAIDTLRDQSKSGCKGGFRLGFMCGKSNDLTTTWAVGDGHLSTVAVIQEWDLWRDAIRDITSVYMLHMAIAYLTGVALGPISFVANKLTLHLDDIPIVNNAVNCCRELVRINAKIEHRNRLFKDSIRESLPIQPDESTEKYERRLQEEQTMIENAKTELKELEDTDPLNRKMVEAYLAHYQISLPENVPADTKCEDLLTMFHVPKIDVIEGAPKYGGSLTLGYKYTP